MATKTITLEIDAYDKLRKAKRSERESFSSVVRRARFEETPATGPEILAQLRRLRVTHPRSFLSDEILEGIAERARSRPVREIPANDTDERRSR